MRLERRQAKLGTSSPEKVQTKTMPKEKSLKDFLSAASETDKHKLKVRMR